MRKDLRASVTLLIVCIFPALLFCTCVSIDVSQYYSNKTICESAMDLGLNSVLADYDRNLYNDYGLLGTDINNVNANFEESFYSNIKETEDKENTKIRIRAMDTLSFPDMLFDEMVQIGAIKTLKETGDYVDETLMMEYQTQTDYDPYIASFTYHKKYYVIGKLLGDISSKIEEHNLSSSKEARGSIASEIANLMVKLENYDPEFRSRLTDGIHVDDGVFYVNSYFPDITLNAWSSLWNNLSSYSYQLLPELYCTYINLGDYNPNEARVNAILSNHYEFESNPVAFYYDDYANFSDLDSYDYAALSLFDYVDTWDENWKAKGMDQLVSEYTYLEKIEDIMQYAYKDYGNCNTAFCNYIMDYFSHYGGDAPTKASVLPNAEVEYILTGQTDIGFSYQIIFNRIFAMRFRENYEAIAWQDAYNAVTSDLSYYDYRYCEYYNHIRADIRWAILESYVETYLVMIRHEPISTYKTLDNMITSWNNLGAGLDLDTVKATIDGYSLDYEECLKLLLMDKYWYSTTSRAKVLIQENEYLRYGDKSKTLDNYCVSVDAIVFNRANAKFTSALKLPGTDVDTSSILHFENINLRETASYIY